MYQWEEHQENCKVQRCSSVLPNQIISPCPQLVVAWKQSWVYFKNRSLTLCPSLNNITWGEHYQKTLLMYCRSVSISTQWLREGSLRVNKTQGWPKGVGPLALIQHIQTIAPKKAVPPSTHIADTQTLSAIDHLKCPVCLEVLSWPVVTVLCATCITSWLTISASFPVSLLLLSDSTRPSSYQSCIQLDLGFVRRYPGVLSHLQTGSKGRSIPSALVPSTVQDDRQGWIANHNFGHSTAPFSESGECGGASYQRTVSHSHIHMHVYMHMHTHMHARTHTHTHVRM